MLGFRTRPARPAPPRDYFYLGDYTAIARMHDGQHIYIDTRDLTIAPHLMHHGHWDTDVEAALMAAMRPGMTVLDVGANFGYFTLIACRRVGTEGRVIAVEANPRLADLLRRSLFVNGYLQSMATVHACAAHSADEPLDLSFCHELSGGGAISKRESHLAWQMQQVTVPGRRIDALVAPGTAIDVIKIDVEGAEYHAFRGMGVLLDGPRPMQIVAEFRSSAVGKHQPPADYLAGFVARGFTLHQLLAEGLSRAYTPAELLAATGDRLCNILMRRGVGAA